MNNISNQKPKSEFISVLVLLLAFFRWDFLSRKKAPLRGDTLVEVMFAVGIFGIVAVGAISIMNRGLYDAQNALEVSMARNEIDAQAESLRFIHNAYIIEKNTQSKVYTKVWNHLKRMIYQPNELPSGFFTKYNGYSCEEIYGSDAFPSNSIVINTRRLDTDIVAAEGSCHLGAFGYCTIIRQASPPVQPLETSPVYPRILYGNAVWSRTYDNATEDLSDSTVDDDGLIHTDSSQLNVQKAQGIWVTGVASDNNTSPEFYDFYIRTCWYAPGSDTSSTISTTIRLFNPDYTPPLN